MFISNSSNKYRADKIMNIRVNLLHSTNGQTVKLSFNIK